MLAKLVQASWPLQAYSFAKEYPEVARVVDVLPCSSAEMDMPSVGTSACLDPSWLVQAAS
jgi:hypothetical protein